ncbi:MAG: hypothetical protein ABI301_05135 [Jatrophihabitantaceae bacterium]
MSGRITPTSTLPELELELVLLELLPPEFVGVLLDVVLLPELLQPLITTAAAAPTATKVIALLRMGGHAFPDWGGVTSILFDPTR